MVDVVAMEDYSSLTLEDLPLELLNQIVSCLPLRDRSRCTKVSRRMRSVSMRWADVKRAEFMGLVPFDTMVFKVVLSGNFTGGMLNYGWFLDPKNLGILSWFTQLRELHLLCDATKLNVEIVDQLKCVDTVVLYNMYFHKESSTISEDSLFRLLGLPRLRHLEISSIAFEPMKRQCILGELEPAHIVAINPNVVSFAAKGMNITSETLSALADRLPKLRLLNVPIPHAGQAAFLTKAYTIPQVKVLRLSLQKMLGVPPVQREQMINVRLEDVNKNFDLDAVFRTSGVRVVCFDDAAGCLTMLRTVPHSADVVFLGTGWSSFIYNDSYEETLLYAIDPMMRRRAARPLVVVRQWRSFPPPNWREPAGLRLLTARKVPYPSVEEAVKLGVDALEQFIEAI